MGNVHEVAQGEGGEQGDPLMPALFSLAYTQCWRLFKKGCPPESVSLPSWTTSTSCADQPGFWKCTAPSKKSCGAMHAYRCTMTNKFGSVGWGGIRPE